MPIGYVVLTYGPKHTRAPLAARPGAAPQVERINELMSKLGRSVSDWLHDYARTPAGPNSYPALFALLAAAEKHDVTALVVLDDLGRLFRKLPPGTYQVMLKALEPHHPRIIDARHEKRLSDMTNTAWVAMLI